MSYKSTNDSDDSEVSLHSDASDSPKARKQKKKRSALKDYFSKQIEHSSIDQGRTSPQSKSYTESLLRKRFKRLMHKGEVAESPKVSFINVSNQSGSDDENSVKTIFPEKLQQIENQAENGSKENLDLTGSEVHSVIEHEDIEPAIDALEEINPIFVQLPELSAPSPKSYDLPQKKKLPDRCLSLDHRYIILSIFFLIISCIRFIGAPFYLVTLMIGIMVPLCVNIISDKVVDIIKQKLYVHGEGPEKTKFILPNYSKMNILEVPSVEEFQVPKSYEGWINLYPNSSYDPETYHLSDTIPVYVKIKGNHLSIHYTKSRVPKRSMYNEPELKLNPTSSLIYNLKNAKVSLLPEGLAKIRHWSKKYPICVDIDTNNIKNDEVFTNDVLPEDVIITKKDEFQDDAQEYSDSTTTNTFKDNLHEDEFKDVEDHDDNSTTRNSTSTLGEEIELNLGDQTESGVSDGKRRILFFARGNREKYDWYIRLLTTVQSLSNKNRTKEEMQNTKVQEENSADIMSSEGDTKAFEKQDSANTTSGSPVDMENKMPSNKTGDFEIVSMDDEHGPEFRSHSLKGNKQYLKYMGHFLQGDHKEDTTDIWKDFNFSINNDVLWFNVLSGRVLLGVLSDPGWIMKIQERIQKKLSTLKLPYFIDELECSELSLGETPPMIHRASRPVMDERGLWVDLDVTYEGLVTLVLSTKLNLMKLKKLNADVIDSNDTTQGCKIGCNQKTSAIYNSDLEDSADSSTSDDQGSENVLSEKNFTLGSTSPTPRKQSNKSFLKVVDQVAASKFFQHATENKYVKKALVAVSNSQLRLELNFRGLIGELVLNIPNPPSDRLWFAFRKPPRLWLSVHPAFGERNVTFTYVTNWIEKKICQEIVKNLVLPNMEDLIIPVLVPQL